MTCTDDLAFVGDDGSDGNFVGVPGIQGLIVSERHKKEVVAYELRRKMFLKGAFGSRLFRVIHDWYLEYGEIENP